jgi:hypothetical protein
MCMFGYVIVFEGPWSKGSFNSICSLVTCIRLATRSQSQGRMREERRMKCMEEKEEGCAFHHCALQID